MVQNYLTNKGHSKYTTPSILLTVKQNETTTKYHTMAFIETNQMKHENIFFHDQK